jgi:hypothetical protein
MADSLRYAGHGFTGIHVNTLRIQRFASAQVRHGIEDHYGFTGFLAALRSAPPAAGHQPGARSLSVAEIVEKVLAVLKPVNP